MEVTEQTVSKHFYISSNFWRVGKSKIKTAVCAQVLLADQYAIAESVTRQRGKRGKSRMAPRVDMLILS